MLGWGGVLTLLAIGCTNAVFVLTEDASPGPDLGRDGDARGAGEDAQPDGPTGLRCDAGSLSACIPEGEGECDPVCQTGTCNWCADKCSYVYSSDQGAVVPACVPMTGKKVHPQACSIAFPDGARQVDDCAPGSICVPPFLGESPSYCFGLCHSQSDCLFGVPCGKRRFLGGGEVSVCDPTSELCGVDGKCCDPLVPNSCGQGRYCFLVDPDAGHSRTVCEFSYGDGRNGSHCATARDCGIMNACIGNACHQVCSSTATCPPGQECNPWGGEFGYCLPAPP